MRQETRKCQNCKRDFQIEPEDFEFYAKIKVPPPTFCPECRLIRRMMFRNERSLYKRKCDATGKEIVSIYSPDKPFKVYDQKYWWSDNWDPMEWGREYDFNKIFFEQFKKLFNEVPKASTTSDYPQKLINSDYCNDSWNIKNCYLCVTAGESENCYYSDIVLFAKEIFDSTWTARSELCYQCIDCYNSSKVLFSQNIYYCLDSYFLFDCRNCSNCFVCVGLRNKQYYIFNRPYSKEEYFKIIKSYDFGSLLFLEKMKQKFLNHKLKFPHRYSLLTNCFNVLGNNVRNSRNCYYCFDVEGDVENSKYIVYAGLGLKDSYDCFNAGAKSSSLFYEGIAVGYGSSNIKFSNHIFYSNYDIQYSMQCFHSSNLFGCIGLRHKQYCILNKQYTKEEYEKLVPKIIEHMNKMPYIDKKGRVYKYGEFFPPELSPFAYNETIAQEYFPLTKEEALEKGYSWKDPEERDYKIDIKTEDLPDHIKDVKDDIIGKVIQCSHAKLKEDGTLEANCNEQCTTAFKIIPQELEFYRKMNLPLPRTCPNCRHYQRIKQRNPLKLWKRKCMCGGQTSVNGIYKNTIEHFHGDNPCPNEFETTYAPDRPEIVYCEKCYVQEVV